MLNALGELGHTGGWQDTKRNIRNWKDQPPVVPSSPWLINDMNFKN